MSKRRSAIHPRRAHIHAHEHIGDKIADATANAIGSWNFIIIQAVVMAVWIVLNTVGWFIWKWDLYPFVFLNLAMSAEAAFSAPIIMQSQNRQASRDRKRDDTEASEVEQLFSSHELLLSINRQQLEILQILKDQEHIDTFVGKLEKQEQVQDVILAKLSTALERKPRARTTKSEAKNNEATI